MHGDIETKSFFFRYFIRDIPQGRKAVHAATTTQTVVEMPKATRQGLRRSYKAGQPGLGITERDHLPTPNGRRQGSNLCSPSILRTRSRHLNHSATGPPNCKSVIALAEPDKLLIDIRTSHHIFFSKNTTFFLFRRVRMAAMLDLRYYTRSYLLSTCTTVLAIPENPLKVFQKKHFYYK